MEVWGGGETNDDEFLFTQVSEALALIEKYDRVRFSNVQRYLHLMVILEGPDAAHLPDVGVCVVGARTVRTIPCARLAATIIHETTHARLRAMGVRLRKSNIAREETLCVRKAIAFLNRLPGGGDESIRMRTLLETELSSDLPWFHKVFE